MGLLPEIKQKGYLVREVRVVNRRGQRVAGFPAEAFARVAGGRFTSLPRGNLAASIFRTIEGKVETIFGDSVLSIDDDGHGVRVTFDYGPARDFDLVVDADGLHSPVLRNQVFNLLSVTWLADLIMARSFKDNFELPEYDESARTRAS